jgi:hypothetical protein
VVGQVGHTVLLHTLRQPELAGHAAQRESCHGGLQELVWQTAKRCGPVAK